MSCIPEGIYCYDGNGLCPYWRHTDYDMVQCGFLDVECFILDMPPSDAAIKHRGNDDVTGDDFLLFDQCKICDINDDWEDE